MAEHSVLDRLLAERRSGGGQVNTSTPIGVPSDYSVSVPAPVPYARDARVTATPNFFEGDDWRPASQPPETIARVQRDLATSGLLKGNYRIGVWDDSTRGAYRDLLTYANAIGEADDQRALRRYMASGVGDSESDEPERQPLVARVSNPVDIKATVKDTARERLGSGKVDPKLEQQIVSGYQQQQVAAQQQEYNMSGGAGGTVVAPPSLEEFAEQQLQKSDPVRYDSRKVVSKFEVIANMLRGGA